ncbi:MAG: Ig-like domain repeat protein, partial [Chloroflexi bacterium]|nr:Ig-like domain repeat protein [Chloroflexota bacterium]
TRDLYNTGFTEGGINAIVTGDFNGDGIPDLAASQASIDLVMVLRGLGDGRFTVLPGITTGGPLDLTVADFNNDGLADVAASNTDNGSVRLLFGSSSSTLTLSASGTSAITDANALVAGDFDGDARADVAVTNSDFSPFAIVQLRGNGSGGFTQAADSPISLPNIANRITTGDFNGDGRLDLALTSGNSDFTPSRVLVLFNNAATVTVTSSPNPSTVGQSVTFTATVTTTVGTPTGSVTFRDNGTTLGTGTLNGSGVATFSTAALTAGTHPITAIYTSTTFPAGTSSTLSQVVVAAGPTATTTALTSSLNPSLFGQTVTFTAIVTGTGGTPTGTVSFLVDGVSIGSAPLSSGQATLSTSSLAVGSRSVQAVYSGDATFATSTSATLTQDVNQMPTTTTLTSSSNPAASGAAVTFTATAAPTAAIAAFPSGTVTFSLNGTALGTSTLSATGVATLTTSIAAAGTHQITAAYGGSASFIASTSAPLDQVVTGGAAPPPSGGGGGGDTGGPGGPGGPSDPGPGTPSDTSDPLAGPGGKRTVTTGALDAGACGFTIDRATGGLARRVPAAVGAVAVLTTDSSAVAYLTAIVPTQPDKNLGVRIQPLANDGLTPPPGIGTVVRAFSVDVCDLATNSLIVKHDPAIMLAVKVSTEALAGVGNDPKRLALARYDATTRLWVRLPTTYDPSNETVKAETMQTSPFAVVQLPPALAGTPVTRPVPLVPINPMSGKQAFLPYVARDAATEAGVNWTTGFQVQNLGSGVASVSISYVNLAGSMIATQRAGIAAGASQTFVGELLEVPAGFEGSAVIASDQPVSVIVNELASDVVLRSASYDGIAIPASVQHLPLLMRNNNGWSTELFVQNAGAGTANARLEYLQNGRVVSTQSLRPLAPGATARVRQAEHGQLAEGWIGAARVVADQPLATMVNELHAEMAMSYTGFVGGVSRLSIPLVMNENGGWSTGVRVQNVGSEAAELSLFVDGSEVERTTLTAGEARTWFPVTGTRTGFVGSVTVLGAEGSRLVAIVNQVSPTTGQASTYRAFGGGSALVSLPLLMRNNSGWYSGVQVQNAGTETTPARLLIDGVVVATATLRPGQSQTWFPVPGTLDGFVGAASIQGSQDTSQLVAIVNQLYDNPDRPLGGDTALTFEGFTQ